MSNKVTTLPVFAQLIVKESVASRSGVVRVTRILAGMEDLVKKTSRLAPTFVYVDQASLEIFVKLHQMLASPTLVSTEGNALVVSDKPPRSHGASVRNIIMDGTVKNRHLDLAWARTWLSPHWTRTRMTSLLSFLQTRRMLYWFTILGSRLEEGRTLSQFR